MTILPEMEDFPRIPERSGVRELGSQLRGEQVLPANAELQQSSWPAAVLLPVAKSATVAGNMSEFRLGES